MRNYWLIKTFFSFIAIVFLSHPLYLLKKSLFFFLIVAQKNKDLRLIKKS